MTIATILNVIIYMLGIVKHILDIVTPNKNFFNQVIK